MDFQVDCHADNDDANAFISRVFAINPVGVDYDPEAWLADLRSGAPIADLLARKSDLPVSPIRTAVVTVFTAPGG